mmetsp:Transcript_50210/g.122530  ORF Transcript_50210/g.122530 Transcript_50210/m.122530 type:complete len:213 (+) Transcript_50210:620-1258(+)
MILSRLRAAGTERGEGVALLPSSTILSLFSWRRAMILACLEVTETASSSPVSIGLDIPWKARMLSSASAMVRTVASIVERHLWISFQMPSARLFLAVFRNPSQTDASEDTLRSSAWSFSACAMHARHSSSPLTLLDARIARAVVSCFIASTDGALCSLFSARLALYASRSDCSLSSFHPLARSSLPACSSPRSALLIWPNTSPRSRASPPSQ